MKYFLSLFLFLFCYHFINAQATGDTIITSTFNYTQTQYSRDSFVKFPDLPGVTYEKIYMLYNIRCKDGLVSPPIQGQTNIGCGEWDYTCNTYVVDSSRTDSMLTFAPSHIITGFGGNTFNYTTQPTYTYRRYKQYNTNYLPPCQLPSEITVGAGSQTSTAPLNTHLKTSKSYYLWKASELSNAGMVAGAIRGLYFDIVQTGEFLHFFRISIKATSDSVLSSVSDLSGMQNVYHRDTLALNNHIFNFTAPFNWNGTDNIILEFSYANSSNGTDYTLKSDTTNYNSGLFTNELDYCYEFAGNSIINLANQNFNALNNKITISFWSNGNQNFLPRNTTLLHAVNAQNNRKINIHFPWENSRFYWDCGATGGSYDRIDKAATNEEVKGTWNHWAFTKDATTGVMNVYKNGVLWHTGTGKTKTFNDITNIVVGNIQGNAYPYYGKIDELSIWNEQLSQSTIQNWMNKKITPNHPNYANLFAYYPFNEGNGNTCTDNSPQNVSSPIQGTPLWRIFKGDEIFKNFTETNNRPKITFVVGNCNNVTIDTVYVYDSIINLSNTVYSFAIQNNAVVPVDTNVYYKAGYSYIYDENTNVIIDSVLNASVGTIQITQMPYYKKYPSIFQLNSFVTPYGINLDLGMQGKTWVFDVTDYAPILKGWKRMFIDGGGERQEDMDIKFVHIVGAPPRNVVDIRNIWKVSNVGYNALLNNSAFEPRDVKLNPNAVSYKIKSAITGHGQEGEFIPQNHFINIDGGAKEFIWNVWKSCAINPVYPQGGTWIYDRAGWCPGMATNIKEMDITPYVTPGSTHSIDYGIDTAWGATNYWISNVLVSYGAANFSLDAAVIDIKNPSNKIEYARSNPICNNPIVTIRNNGSTPLISLQIDYWVNGNPNHESYTWTGNLAFMETEDVSLPFSDNLWSAVNGPNNNEFHVEISNPNQDNDSYSYNNKFSSEFNIANVVPADFVIWFKTNSAASESKYEILDQNGQQVFVRDNMTNNTNYKDTLHLGWGCYKLIIHDSDEDGLSFFANNDGSGFARLRTLNNANIINFQADFGHSIEYNFTVDYPLSYEQLYKDNIISVYPNPASNVVNVQTEGIVVKDIVLFNQTGQKQNIPYTQQNNLYSFNTKHLAKGIYFIKVISENNTLVRKIAIE